MTTAPTPESSARATNVVAALANVMRDLPSIGRDHTSPQGYAYRGIEDITRAAQPLLAREGVVMAPHRVEWDETHRFTINNRPWSDERITVTYRVYGPGGPDDFIEVEAPGIGRDNADKGANKAMTQAFKYALIQALCIADARDDADSHPTQQADAHVPASTERIEALRQEVEAVEDDAVRAAFTRWKDEQEFYWPWSAEAVEAMQLHLRKLLHPSNGAAPLAVVPDPPETSPETPPEAPEKLVEAAPVSATGEATESASEPHSGAESVPVDEERSEDRAEVRLTRFTEHVEGLALSEVRRQLEAQGIEPVGTPKKVRGLLVARLVEVAEVAESARPTA